MSCAKTQVIGQVLLGADYIENRMNSIAVKEMVFGRYRPVDEILVEMESVTQESLQEFVIKYFDFNKMGLLALGQVPKDMKRGMR